MMIEAVPFFHILVNIIESEIGDDVSDHRRSDFSIPISPLIKTASQYHRDHHGVIRIQLNPDR